jgi:glycosyltransferase involved in cell wall biosynthesis
VGLIGRLVDTKGIEYFIDAISEVIAQCPDARFQIIGSGQGDYVNTLRERSRQKGLENVLCFCGFQYDIFPYLLKMSILVSASLSEG